MQEWVKTMNDFFPVAVWYGENRARAPMMPRSEIEVERTRKDIQNIISLGFNCVKYWVDWATCEASEGKYDFSQAIDFLDLADEFGIKVVIQVYLDSAPNWIHAKYPDALYRAHSGQEVESQASPGYSLDHPAVRNRAGEFMTALSEAAAQKKSFYAWDVWSEPHIVNWSWFDFIGVEPWFDYNDHSRARFVGWLRKKYESIQQLNKVWYRTYGSWDEVRIPKYVTLSTFVDIMDFQYFNMEKLKEDLKWRYDAIRRGDPSHIISSHSDRTSVLRVPLGRGGNTSDWLMAQTVDVWGTSFYPKHVGSSNPLDPASKGFSIDASRCSCESNGKVFWIGELQCGPGVVGARFGDKILPGDLANWAWTCVSRGAKGLFYYAYYPMSCGEEISGFGLVHPDGDLTERSSEAGIVAKTITKHRDIFLHAKTPASEVAIMYSPESYALLMALREKNGNLITSSLRGTYRILFEKNIRCDFIETGSIGSVIPPNYKIIFMPFCVAVDMKLADVLKRFVSSGGTLVAEFRPGWSDAEGNNLSKIPGMGLDDVFGCIESSWRSAAEPKFSMTCDGGKRRIIGGSEYEENFITTTGKVIGRFQDGGAAFVANSFGRGKALLFGTLLSKRYEETRDNTVRRLFEQIVGDAGVNAETEIRPNSKDVEVRNMKTGDGQLLFVFNHGKRVKRNVELRVKNASGRHRCTNLVDSKRLRVTSFRSEIRLRLDLEINSVTVLHLEKEK